MAQLLVTAEWVRPAPTPAASQRAAGLATHGRHAGQYDGPGRQAYLAVHGPAPTASSHLAALGDPGVDASVQDPDIGHAVAFEEVGGLTGPYSLCTDDHCRPVQAASQVAVPRIEMLQRQIVRSRDVDGGVLTGASHVDEGHITTSGQKSLELLAIYPDRFATGRIANAHYGIPPNR